MFLQFVPLGPVWYSDQSSNQFSSLHVCGLSRNRVLGVVIILFCLSHRCLLISTYESLTADEQPIVKATIRWARKAREVSGGCVSRWTMYVPQRCDKTLSTNPCLPDDRTQRVIVIQVVMGEIIHKWLTPRPRGSSFR